MQVRTTAEDLARWLELRGGDWTVHGEPSLVRTLPLPASARSLAVELRQRPGELLILAPDTCELIDHAYVGVTELPMAAYLVEGHHVLQLAWVTPEGVTDSWLLAEHDRTAPSGDQEATATRIVAGLRQPWPTPSITRKRT